MRATEMTIRVLVTDQGRRLGLGSRRIDVRLRGARTWKFSLSRVWRARLRNRHGMPS